MCMYYYTSNAITTELPPTAMHMGLGGNPYGPAGTGKTESVKALGGLFGRQVLVFNCDEVRVDSDIHVLCQYTKCTCMYTLFPYVC